MRWYYFEVFAHGKRTYIGKVYTSLEAIMALYRGHILVDGDLVTFFSRP